LSILKTLGDLEEVKWHCC